MKHFNQNNQPLCGSATWITDSDSLHLKKEEVNCEECERILRKQEWASLTQKQKEGRWDWAYAEFLRILSQEMVEKVENGETIEPYDKYPKTEEFAKANIKLYQRHNLGQVTNIIGQIVYGLTCHHHDLTKTPLPNGHEHQHCNDCGVEREYWETFEQDDPSDFGWGCPGKTIGHSTNWALPKKKD